MKNNKGLIPSIKESSFKEPPAEITAEDIKIWQAQLNIANIPKREYVDVIGIKKHLNKLIKLSGKQKEAGLFDENSDTFNFICE